MNVADYVNIRNKYWVIEYQKKKKKKNNMNH